MLLLLCWSLLTPNSSEALHCPKDEKRSYSNHIGKASEIVDMKTHQLRRNREAKNTIAKLNNIERRSRTPNSSLEDQANRLGRKAKLASAKRSNQEKRSTRRIRRRNLRTKLLQNCSLNTTARLEAKTREIHGSTGRALRGRKGYEAQPYRQERGALTPKALSLQRTLQRGGRLVAGLLLVAAGAGVATGGGSAGEELLVLLLSWRFDYVMRKGMVKTTVSLHFKFKLF